MAFINVILLSFRLIVSCLQAKRNVFLDRREKRQTAVRGAMADDRTKIHNILR